VLTGWEPIDRADLRVADRLRRVDLAAGLQQAGFTGIEVRDRPSWLRAEHAMWQEAAALDASDGRIYTDRNSRLIILDATSRSSAS
jgi:hypothetical protein